MERDRKRSARIRCFVGGAYVHSFGALPGGSTVSKHTTTKIPALFSTLLPPINFELRASNDFSLSKFRMVLCFSLRYFIIVFR